MSSVSSPPGTGRDAVSSTFPGTSEVARRARALDWAATPLGAVADWPPALRTIVRTCIESSFPVNLWCGPELVLIYNDGYRRLLGAKHPGAFGRRGTEVWAEIWDGIAPMFEEIRSGGPGHYHEDHPFLVSRAGEDEPAWFTYSLSPVRDDDGEVVAFLNVVSETTARVRFEQEAEAARAAAELAQSRLREVFEQAPVAVCVLRGPRHVYELVNPLYQRLVPGRALLGRPILEALPELAGQGIVEMLDHVFRTGVPYVASQLTLQLDRRGTGMLEEVAFTFVYQPVRDAAGEVTAIAVVATDVTEHVQARRAAEAAQQSAERAQRAAEEANAAKAQFLAMMSHELRTPLNAIGGYAQLLELGVHGAINAAQSDALGRIQASQQHLLGLITAVLNYARLEAGRVHFLLADVAVVDAAREVEALMTGQARAAGLTLENACTNDGGALIVRADAEKLRQILLNLLSNAVKFTPAGGRVALTCDADSARVRVHVADTGRGIDADQLARAFEPFVQIGRDYSTQNAGTGLGLAISRDLARGMGGDLTAVSEPGAGSTFTLELPRA